MMQVSLPLGLKRPGARRKAAMQTHPAVGSLLQVEGVGSVAAAQANSNASASDEADLLTLLQTIL